MPRFHFPFLLLNLTIIKATVSSTIQLVDDISIFCTTSLPTPVLCILFLITGHLTPASANIGSDWALPTATIYSTLLKSNFAQKKVKIPYFNYLLCLLAEILLRFLPRGLEVKEFGRVKLNPRDPSSPI